MALVALKAVTLASYARSGCQHVHHFLGGIDVGHLDVSVGIRIGMARVVDRHQIRGILHHPFHHDAAGGRVSGGLVQRVLKASRLTLQYYHLSPVGASVLGPCHVGVGQVLGDDVHPEFLGGEAGSGDIQ